jgi:hypothetical protein
MSLLPRQGALAVQAVMPEAENSAASPGIDRYVQGTGAAWAVEPSVPGDNLPEGGRSLFGKNPDADLPGSEKSLRRSNSQPDSLI